MNEKLELIRTNVYLNKQEFCKKLNITYQTYQNYLKGRDISTDVAIKLNNIFNININWLLTGKGDMFITNEPCANIENTSNLLVEKKSSFEEELFNDIKKLSSKKQEYYYHKIKSDLIEDELKSSK